MFQDTICALATPQGSGALGIIRVSGENSVSIVNSIFKGKNLEKEKSHTVSYGFIKDADEIIDEVMVSIFLAPKTFTAENLVEISCHGSAFIEKNILALLIKQGCRLANPGEFTQRAFLNGRIDLSQAEAVADLIAAENKTSRQIALQQMRGGFSHELNDLRTRLIEFTALTELELDFSEEDVEFVNKSHLQELISKILLKIQPLIDSFKYGNAIKNGIPVAIVGKPNSGKSTLLNFLLNEERAIVSNIPGTTRDVIEEKIVIEDIQFRFIDTAGIRQTEDLVESLGIKKTFEKAKQAKVILYLLDATETTLNEVREDIESLQNKENTIILCPNKLDLFSQEQWGSYIKTFEQEFTDFSIIPLSTQKGINLEKLKNELVLYIQSLKENIHNFIVVNQRHWDELEKTKEALFLSSEILDQGMSGEFISFHLREALKHLGNITGAVEIDKDILGTIFGRFCIGK